MKKLLPLFSAIACFLLFALTGCSGGDAFTAKSYASGDAAIESVHIDVTDRKIEIGASDDDQIHIDYFDGEKEFLDIALSERKELTVKLATDKTWTDFVGTKPSAEYRCVSVKLPRGISDLVVQTTNGTIKLEPLAVSGSIALSSNGGDILFEKIDAGKSLNFTTKNGDVSGTAVGGWDDYAITCNIKKGNCNLPAEKAGGAKTLTANCNNGDIKIEFVKSE